MEEPGPGFRPGAPGSDPDGVAGADGDVQPVGKQPSQHHPEYRPGSAANRTGGGDQNSVLGDGVAPPVVPGRSAVPTSASAQVVFGADHSGWRRATPTMDSTAGSRRDQAPSHCGGARRRSRNRIPIEGIPVRVRGYRPGGPGHKRIGSIEAGKYADLVAVAADPLQDVHVLEHVSFVMKNGVVYKNQ